MDTCFRYLWHRTVQKWQEIQVYNPKFLNKSRGETSRQLTQGSKSPKLARGQRPRSHSITQAAYHKTLRYHSWSGRLSRNFILSWFYQIILANPCRTWSLFIAAKLRSHILLWTDILHGPDLMPIPRLARFHSITVIIFSDVIASRNTYALNVLYVYQVWMDNLSQIMILISSNCQWMGHMPIICAIMSYIQPDCVIKRSNITWYLI